MSRTKVSHRAKLAGAVALVALSLGAAAAVPLGMALRPHTIGGVGLADPSPGTGNPAGYLAGAYTVPGFSAPAPWDIGGTPLGFCITPSAASPNQSPGTTYSSSTSYTNPQGASFTNNGGFAWMMYWVQAVDTWGSWTDGYGNTWTSANVADAVASIISQDDGEGDFYTGVNGLPDYYGPGPANGSTAAAEQLPNEIKALSGQAMGPWTLSISGITNASTGATVTSLTSGTNYNATVHLAAASGNPVTGVALVVGGTSTSQVGTPTNERWLNSVTDANGNAVLQFNYSGSAGSVGMTFNAIGAGNSTADGGPGPGPLFAIPASGSGYQALMVPGSQPVGTFGVYPMGSQPKAAYGQVAVQKTNTDPTAPQLNPATGAENGASFNIVNSSGADTQYPTGAVIQQLTIGAPLSLAPNETPLSGHLPLGTYTLVETSAPAGQQIASPKTFTLTTGNQVLTVSFTDPVNSGALTISKAAAGAGSPLAGAEFVVVETPPTVASCAPISSGNPANAATSVTIPGCASPVSTDAFATGTNGQVDAPGGTGPNPILSNLAPGTYAVQEVKSPAGYALPASPTQDVTVYPSGMAGVQEPAQANFSDLFTSSLTTSASQFVSASSTATDTATLTAATGAGGSITFSLYGPFTSAASITPTSCDASSGTSGYNLIGSNNATVTGPGSYPSAGVGPLTTPGVYAWVASYSGDASSTPAAGTCGDPTELSVVTSISTSANHATSATATALSDTATVGGPSDLAGSVAFDLYGPLPALTTTGCTTPVFTSDPVAVSGPGAYTPATTYTPTKPGVYEWTATFTGSGTYAGVTDAEACGVAAEATAILSVTTNATSTSSGALSDTATVGGPSDTTGSVVFDLYGPFPNTTTTGCTTPVFTSAPVAVTKPGTYPMPGSYTPTKPGVYEWVEHFTGSGPYAGVTGAGLCGESGEVNSVLGLTTTAAVSGSTSTAAVTGQQLVDTLDFTGSVPAGSTVPVTWKLYGPVAPSGSSCAGVSWSSAPVFATGTVPLTSATMRTTASPPVTAAGCYTYAESWATTGAVAGDSVAPGAPAEAILVSVAGSGNAGAGGGNGGGGGLSIQTDEGLWTPPAAPGSILPSGPVGTIIGSAAAAVMVALALLAILWQRRRRLSTWLAAAAGIIAIFLLIGTTLTGTTSTSSSGAGGGYDVAHPAVAAPPVHPSSPSAIQAASTSGGPPTLIIPALGVTAPILPESVTVAGGQRSLSIPNDIHEVGLYTAPGVPQPGDPGVAIIAGHIDSAAAGPGALYHLLELRPGDKIVVANVDGRTTTWTVASNPQVMSKAALARLSWPTSGPPYLALVTCGGPFDYSTGHYLDNVVVYASPAA